MSDLGEVLRRAQTDYDFYQALLTDPEPALSGYTLTASEREALTGDQPRLWQLAREAELRDRAPIENGGPP